MASQLTDMDILGKMLILSRLEKMPTACQRKEFRRLRQEMEKRLSASLELEEKTLKLVELLKAA